MFSTVGIPEVSQIYGKVILLFNKTYIYSITYLGLFYNQYTEYIYVHFMTSNIILLLIWLY